MTRPTDHAARLTALTRHDVSILVEAGAGSGKTTLMAGRIARMLANGTPPDQIAAITFTEAAATHLRNAIHDLLTRLERGDVPSEVADAFPDAGEATFQATVDTALAHLDALTCSTIHAFARVLTTPYPVEANVDPGATMLEPHDANRMFHEVRETWLRSILDEDGSATHPLLTQLFLREPAETRKALDALTNQLRNQPDVQGPAPVDLEASRHASAIAARDFAHAVESDDIAPDEAHAFAEGARTLAEALDDAADDVALLARTLGSEASHHHVLTQSGGVRQYRTKKYWKDTAKSVGLPASEGEARHGLTQASYDTFTEALETLRIDLADTMLHELVTIAHEGVAAYHDAKRRAALLDPDDLLRNAADLLRHHADVRDELARRFRYVLIDEFQDTDPLQAEIVWRLTGEPSDEPWREWLSRPGARFIVGDPKQSIYRFRQADVTSYLDLRQRMEDDPNALVLTIHTNFRSRHGILDLTNATFERHFQGPTQPGYQALEAHAGASHEAAILRLPHTDIVDDPDDTFDATLDDEAEDAPTTQHPRTLEANAVADLCAHLLANHRHEDGTPLMQRDIALLAPTGTGLDAYERALERRGLAVTSPAGKNYYQQQIVHDLLALTRALADPNDTLALGAMLRGPLIGIRDDELVTATQGMREAAAHDGHTHAPQRMALRIDTPIDDLPAGAVRDALARLQPLAERAWARTPFDTLHDAIDTLDVIAILHLRNPRHARRDLANLERFLGEASAYATRGLRAYAHDVWRAWSDNVRDSEAATDEHDDAITLMSIHASKGLEWPIVIPINLFHKPQGVSGPLRNRSTNTLHHKLFNLPTSGFEATKQFETDQIAAEVLRLGYVLTTRARDLLVLPEVNMEIHEASWYARFGWPESSGERIDVPTTSLNTRFQRQDGGPDERTFEQRSARLREALPTIERRAPSDHDDPEEPVREDVTVTETQNREQPSDGLVRGRLVHKLLEELITGECTEEGLEARARELDGQHESHPDVDPSRVAEQVRAAWNLDEVRAVRDRLMAEVPVARADQDDVHVRIVNGLADAVAVARDDDGGATLVIDWKSDKTTNHLDVYRNQLEAYLRLLGAPQGLLIFTSIDHVEHVVPPR